MPSKSPDRRQFAAALFESRWPIWLAAWNSVAVILFLRGLARQTADVPSWQIVLIAMLLIALTNIPRWWLVHNPWPASEVQSAPPRWLPFAFTPAAVILTLWLTTLQPSVIAAVSIWLLLISSEVACLALNWPFQSTLPDLVAMVRERTAMTKAEPNAGTDIVDEETPPLADDVDQRIQRSNRDGVDEVHGLLRVRYQPGQRVGNLFAGFVPPLLPSPTADAEAVWGSEATVSIVDIHAQGVELEVRRDSVDDGETSTVVEFYARAADQQ
ncbi:hypothetical protein [Rosistilla ulvae]|uniref:hypothetical protein n=1 Tax=Rosistilla ulvae TaxID=1930277 RepID=UPI0011A852BC|nr:hypothetical protein [Rosistilla ulvae]